MFLGGAGQVLNIFAQVGLVMLIGLAGGNAILIVDLANQKMGEGEFAGRQVFCQVTSAAILMTAISSLTGFLPLMLASGAGAQSQSSLGLVVFGGLWWPPSSHPGGAGVLCGDEVVAGSGGCQATG